MFRPDLLVSSIAIEPIPDKPARDTYLATIENDGNAPAAGPFSVTFTPAASATPGVTPVTTTKTIQRLDVGASDEVTFGGPACTAATAPTVVVDPGDTVAESDFTNNSLAVDPSCPALTSAPTPTSTSGS
jgi:hypothetical protein